MIELNQVNIFILIIALSVFVLLFGCPQTLPVCGNGVCEIGETSQSCSIDCPSEQKTCSQQNGYTCSVNEQCGTQFLQATDTTRCCQNQCTPSQDTCTTQGAICRNQCLETEQQDTLDQNCNVNGTKCCVPKENKCDNPNAICRNQCFGNEQADPSDAACNTGGTMCCIIKNESDFCENPAANCSVGCTTNEILDATDPKCSIEKFMGNASCCLPKGPVCGNGIIEGSEQCEYDSDCSERKSCNDSCSCIPKIVVCGNNICEMGETSATCPRDCDTGGNIKDRSKYSAKEVFIVSDKNWSDVLSLTPIAAYDEEGQSYRHPLLIYHNETSSSFTSIDPLKLKVEFSVFDSNGAELGDDKVWKLGYFAFFKLLAVGQKAQFNISVWPNVEKGEQPDLKIHKIVLNSWPDFLELNTPVEMTMPEKGGNVHAEFTLARMPDAGFDADSIIYFLQQYGPSKVTIIGSPPQELADLLIAPKPLGAGLAESQLQSITSNDYLSYWNSYDTLAVADANNYRTGMLAASFAAITNRPILFADADNILLVQNAIRGKKVVVAGTIDATVMQAITQNALSKTELTHDALMEEFKKKTGTTRIILTNPFDLSISNTEVFTPEKSGNLIQELYQKTSLIAPYLAATRKELIVALEKENPTGTETDAYLKSKIAFLKTNQPEYTCNIGEPCMKGQEEHDTTIHYADNSITFEINMPQDGLSNNLTIYPTDYYNYSVDINTSVPIKFNAVDSSFADSTNVKVEFFECNPETQDNIRSIGSTIINNLRWSRTIDLKWNATGKTRVCIKSEISKENDPSNIFSSVLIGNEVNDGVNSQTETIKVYAEPIGEETSQLNFNGFFYDCADSEVDFNVLINGQKVSTNNTWPCNELQKLITQDQTGFYISTREIPKLAVGDEVTFEANAKIYASEQLSLIMWGYIRTSGEIVGSKFEYLCQSIDEPCAPITQTTTIKEKYTRADVNILFNETNVRGSQRIMILGVSSGYTSLLAYVNSMIVPFEGPNAVCKDFALRSKEYAVLSVPIPESVLLDNIEIRVLPQNGLFTSIGQYTGQESLDEFFSPFRIKKVALLPNEIAESMYLTIVGSKKAVPFSEFHYSSIGYDFMKTLDAMKYADIYGDDAIPDMAVGRISGISISDASTLVNRSVFSNEIGKNNNVRLMASSFTDMIENANAYAEKFRGVGYNATSHTNEESCYNFNPNEWNNNDIIWYMDHGAENWAGIISRDIPYLSSSIVLNNSCGTCSSENSDSFCTTATRKGAVMHMGNSSIAWSGSIAETDVANKIFAENKTIGTAFTRAYRNNYYENRGYYSLIGDPLFDYNARQNLIQWLGYSDSLTSSGG